MEEDAAQIEASSSPSTDHLEPPFEQLWGNNGPPDAKTSVTESLLGDVTDANNDSPPPDKKEAPDAKMGSEAGSQAMRLSWERYKAFEEFRRGGPEQQEQESLSLMEFIAEWESRLKAVLATGLPYSDTLLAYKLIDSANLHEYQLDVVFTSVDFFTGTVL